MKTKLLFSTLILWIVNIFVYYLFGYPENYSLNDIITKHVEWKPLLSIYFILIAITAFFSFVLYRKLSFFRKLILSIIYINIFITLLSLSYGFYRFYENKKELDESILSFQQEAYRDIKKDKIRVFGSGLTLPPKNKIDFQKQIKKDSIQKKYGLINVSYCMISESLEISKKEYNKITEPYLEKRNGKFWKERMRKEIDSVLKTIN